MKIEGYVLEILKKLEEKGYEAYIAKDAVILHCLEKPIEEYEIITSAPLFFLYEGKAESKLIMDVLPDRRHGDTQPSFLLS